MKRIISVSYKDDTPAFFSEEFFDDVLKGYRDIHTKFGTIRVSLLPQDVYCFVFWTKNCSDHFIRNMQSLKSPYYIHWTITGYDRDLEENLRNKQAVMERFKTVSRIIGPENIIWRYDPIILNDKYTIEYHAQQFEKMAASLEGYTTRCVISFFDEYGKIQDEIHKGLLRKPTDEEVRTIAKSIGESARRHGLKVQTCAERGYDLTEFGITERPCVDPEHIEALCGEILPAALKRTDSFRRCNCAVNTDIGTYHRCKHGCRYCYAK